MGIVVDNRLVAKISELKQVEVRFCEAAGKESRFYFMSGTLNRARKSTIKEARVKH